MTSGNNCLEFCHQTGQGNGEVAVSLGFYESKVFSPSFLNFSPALIYPGHDIEIPKIVP